MGQTRDLFKKIRDTKGIFHAKMGSIKDRNGRDLTESEDIKKRWQKYTEELEKKGLNDLDNHNGVVTHLEPDILECSQVGLWKHHYEVLIKYNTMYNICIYVCVYIERHLTDS